MLVKTDIETLKGSIDVRALIEYYGGQVFIDDAATLRSSCVVHGGSNATSLVYRKDSGYFRCYACDFRSDALGLIREIESCSFAEAVEKAQQFSNGGGNGYTPRPNPVLADPWVRALKTAYREENKNEIIDSVLVRKAAEYEPNPYVESERFEKATIEYFGVGFCDLSGPFENRAIIPIHDEDGNLVGFSGRDMTGTAANQKYRIKKGFHKGYALYNLHRAKEFVTRRKPLVLVEGFGQVWRLHESGIHTGVALMGKDLTSEQYDLLLRHTTKLVLGLDFDDAGVQGTCLILEKLSGRIDLQVLVSPFGEEKDLGDLSPEKVREIYRDRVSANKWLGIHERRV